MKDKAPEVPLTPETAFMRLQKWFLDKKELAEAKAAEHLERVRLASFYFTSPIEGTNRLGISPGYDLKLTHGYNYKVDEAALENVTPADIKRLKLPWDELFVYKPELSTKTYRTLTAEQKKFVDELIEVKDASPQLEIVPAKQDKAPAYTEEQHPHRRADDNEPAIAAQMDDGVAYDVVVEDMDQAQPGNFYQDGDGDWWIVKADGDWEQCDAPTNLPPPQPKPARRGRKAK